MGEIRVAAKITNALDVARESEGQGRKRKSRSYDADAMVDTGAVQTVIPAHVVERLGVGIREQRVVEFADGRKVAVGVTGPLLIEILGRDTFDEALVLGDEVLIGQTVLEKLDLLADCGNRRLIPNPAHPVVKVKRRR
jgi:clan AA aspartic protease